MNVKKLQLLQRKIILKSNVTVWRLKLVGSVNFLKGLCTYTNCQENNISPPKKKLMMASEMLEMFLRSKVAAMLHMFRG